MSKTRMGPRETALRQTVEDLRSWLMDVPYTWSDVARLGGVSRMSLYNLRNPKWKISVNVMCGIARARDQIEKMEAAEKEKVG